MFFAQYLLLATAIVVFELLRKKSFTFDFLTFVHLMFMLGYVITPVYFYSYSFNQIFYGQELEIYGITLLAYFSLVAGWELKGKLVFHPQKTNLRRTFKVVKAFSWLTFFVGALYITGKGGIVNVLSSGALVRYGIEESSSSSVDFLMNVYSMAEIITYVLFAMLLSSNYVRYRKKIRLYYLFVLFFYMVYLLSISSRGAIASLLIFHIMIYWYYNRNFLRTIIVGLPFLVLLTLYGKQVFFAIASALRGEVLIDAFLYLNEIRQRQVVDQDGVLFYGFMREYTHTIQSLGMAISSIEKLSFTFFSDFFLALLRIIPQKITMQFLDVPDTISRVNTQLLISIDEASIPPGLVAHFYYSLGIIGIFVGFFFYGFIGRSLNNYLHNLFRNNDVYFVFYAFFGFTFGSFVVNGDPNVYFYSVLWPFVLLFLSLVFFRLPNNLPSSTEAGKSN